MTAAVGLSSTGIEFASLDRAPVYTVFLLLSPEDRPEEHLKAMEVIFKNLSKDAFRRQLRQAQTVVDVRGVLTDADGQHLVA
jgi:mannitol/fructose-specific phosphotransferase system IIA component (Ntr-type)